MFLDGFKLVFDVSRYEKPLIDIFVDFEDLVLFVLGLLFRRLIIVNVGDWIRFISVESRVRLFW